MMFQNKVVVVTGGTSGIGLACAKKFLAEGARVIIVGDRTENERGEKYDALAASLGAQCAFVQADVRDEAAVQNLVAATLQKYGAIDIVVNSAGVYAFSQTDITTMPLADFERMMDINFRGVFLMTKYALSELLKTRGTIINIASSLGVVPEAESPIYCASKAAVIMFSKSVALAQAAAGVRVNAVCPGPIDTPLLHRAFPDAKEYADYVALNPMRRAGQPEEVAALVAFLASADAAYITGGVYSIDGGEALR